MKKLLKNKRCLEMPSQQYKYIQIIDICAERNNNYYHQKQ